MSKVSARRKRTTRNQNDSHGAALTEATGVSQRIRPLQKLKKMDGLRVELPVRRQGILERWLEECQQYRTDGRASRCTFELF